MVKEIELDAVRRWLEEPETHQRWMLHGDLVYQKFCEGVFDRVIDAARPPKAATFLDAGCGLCVHAIRLAARGFLVHAIDFSGTALNMARVNVKESGLYGRIRIESGSLIDLPFKDESFRYILCWGVLMHIPELEKAITEISRVLHRGGSLIISEANMNSLDSILARILIRNLRGSKTEIRKTSAGIEYWTRTGLGMTFTRHVNVQWLVRRFANEGLVVQEHISGQFSEAYTMVGPTQLRNIIHCFNRFWFIHVQNPRRAHSNILIFRKPN